LLRQNTSGEGLDVAVVGISLNEQGGGPGTPVSLTFLGNLFGEANLLAVAKAYQDATDFHLKHPDLNAALQAMKKPA